MISARTARIDDNLGRGTDGSNPVSSSDESATNRPAYVRQGLFGPTVPTFWTSNPAYAQVQNEHVWQTAWSEIIQDKETLQAAAEKAFKRVEEMFAKYPITQT